jgi:subtilisin family serine protease
LRELVQRAVTRARESGVTVFAALGNAAFDINDPDFLAMYMPIPAELDGVIGVSATNYFDEKASYSNYGFDITDIAAPGGDLGVVPEPGFEGDGALLGAWAPDSSTNPGAMYAWLQGTSMACPNAAGVAALIVSQYGDFSPYRMRGPHLAPKIVENYLRQSAFPLNDERYYGAGLVDALGAVTIERMERTAAPPSAR